MVEGKVQPPFHITEADSGLGTTFERWALNRYLSRLYEEGSIHSVLEGPGDGMTGISGINSLILGLKGACVSLMLPDHQKASFARQTWSYYGNASDNLHILPPDARFNDFNNDEFDLVWNFNVILRQPDPRSLLKEMCRISRRYVLVFVPSARNYSFFLHRLHHKRRNEPWEHGPVELMQPAPYVEMFRQFGFHVRETVLIDCPWWPDIVDFGQLISDFFPFPFMKGLSQRARPENRYLWPANNLPYYEPALYPEAHEHMGRLSYFETSRLSWIKQFFAHHVGILGEKGAGL